MTRYTMATVAPFDWFEASKETGFTNGAAVGTLTNFGSSAANATQATSSAQPTYTTGAINGQPAIHFDGGDFLDSTSSLVSTSTQTCFAVVSFDSTAADHTVMGAVGAGGTQWKIDAANTRMAVTKENTSVMIREDLTTITAAAWNIIAFDLNGTTAGHTYKNGTDDTNTTVLAALTAARTLSVGANRASTASEFMLGYIAALITFARVLTTDERSSVHSYLQDQYSIAVSDYQSAAPPRRTFATRAARVRAAFI